MQDCGNGVAGGSGPSIHLRRCRAEQAATLKDVALQVGEPGSLEPNAACTLLFAVPCRSARLEIVRPSRPSTDASCTASVRRVFRERSPFARRPSDG
jgi:hypothetical protein